MLKGHSVIINLQFSPGSSLKYDKPFAASRNPPNKQIWIKTSSFRLFRLAFILLRFGVAPSRRRIPGGDISCSAASSIRISPTPSSCRLKPPQNQSRDEAGAPVIPGKQLSAPRSEGEGGGKKLGSDTGEVL